MLGDDGIEVIQGLLIFAVEHQDLEVRVDIYGGADSVCGTLVYNFTDAHTATERASILARWCDQQTPVTYVRRDGAASLMDEVAVLSEAFEA